MVAPVELVRELLAYRDMKIVSARDLGMITGLLAGASIAFPVLTPVAIGSLIAAGVQKLRGMRMRAAIAGIEPVVPLPPANATAADGVARKLRATIASIEDDSAVLAEHGEIWNEGLILRRSETAPFWLERQGAPPVLVAGPTRRIGPRRIGPLPPSATPIARGDARLARMGVPADFAISGALALTAIREMTPVTIIGALEEESVAEAAFHREGGRVPVMRGRPGAPLLVSY
jgi:hypothetical protein